MTTPLDVVVIGAGQAALVADQIAARRVHVG